MYHQVIHDQLLYCSAVRNLQPGTSPQLEFHSDSYFYKVLCAWLNWSQRKLVLLSTVTLSRDNFHVQHDNSSNLRLDVYGPPHVTRNVAQSYVPPFWELARVYYKYCLGTRPVEVHFHCTPRKQDRALPTGMIILELQTIYIYTRAIFASSCTCHWRLEKVVNAKEKASVCT